ncbi:MAG TPA: hypothetical protein VF718_08225 [Allosphingosinicella sp.]
MHRKSKNKVEEDRVGFKGPASPEVSPGHSPDGNDWGDDWVHKLIAMTRPGVEIEFPSRTLSDRPIPFEYDDFS